jgi:uncharacterized membrane protein
VRAWVRAMDRFTTLRRGVLTIVVLWVAALIAAPVLQARASSSRPSAILAAALVYVAGSHVCHQRPERSFRILDRQMPVCARCTGLYVSGLAGLALGLVRRRAVPGTHAARVALAIALLPTLASLLVEWSGSIDPGNAGRFVAALPLGAVVGIIVASGLANPTGTR